MTYLRFGIPDLLWAMVVVGLGIALWLERAGTVRLRAENDTLRHQTYVLKGVAYSGGLVVVFEGKHATISKRNQIKE